MSHPCIDYLLEMEKAARRRRFSAVHLIIPVGAMLVTGAVLWSHLATREVYALAEGQVVPATPVQLVQNSDGGMLREVMVADGDRVTAGQVVAHFDDTRLKAQLDSQNLRRASLAAAAARLDAEAGGAALHLPAEIQTLVPEVASQEKALFKARKAAVASALAILNQELTQRRSELAVLEGRDRSVGRSLAFLDQELAIGRDLAGEGLRTRIELLKLERQVNDAAEEQETIRNRLPAARAAVDEAEQRIGERSIAFEIQARQDLTKIEGEIASLDASLATLTEGAAGRDIRAPVDGVVKRVATASVGALMEPGATLMEVTPESDTVMIEGKVKVSDLPWLRLGQTASVRIGRQTKAGNGVVVATLDEVGAHAQTDSGGEPFYRVRLRSTTLVPPADQNQSFRAGMTATAEIFTGRQSVLDYVLQPVRTTRAVMLREQ